MSREGRGAGEWEEEGAGEGAGRLGSGFALLSAKRAKLFVQGRRERTLAVRFCPVCRILKNTKGLFSRKLRFLVAGARKGKGSARKSAFLGGSLRRLNEKVMTDVPLSMDK